MFEPLGEVVGLLLARGVPHALVGAAAMAGLGIVRASDDVDLLTLERAVLDPHFWAPLASQGLDVDVRRGDPSDPLAGVVRLSGQGTTPIDVVVGRGAWQQEILGRARAVRLGALQVPLVGAADLVLLKLYAGGSQDAADVRSILAAADLAQVRDEVEARLPDLPRDCAALWRRILDGP